MPRTNLMSMALLAAGMWFMAGYFGSWVYYFLLWLLGIAILFSLVTVLSAAFFVRVSVGSKRSKYPRGAKCSFYIKAENLTVFPLVRVGIEGEFLSNIIPEKDQRIKNDLEFAIPPKGALIREFMLNTDHCAVHHINPKDVWVSDVFGFFMLKIRFRPQPFFVYVLPHEIEFAAKKMPRGKQVVRLTHERDELREIDKMAGVDSPRNINWKQTMRRGDIMVNRYEVNDDRGLIIIADKSTDAVLSRDEEGRLGDLAGDLVYTVAKKTTEEHRKADVIILDPHAPPVRISAHDEVSLNDMCLRLCALQPQMNQNINPGHGDLLRPFADEIIQTGALLFICCKSSKETEKTLEFLKSSGVEIQVIVNHE